MSQGIQQMQQPQVADKAGAALHIQTHNTWFRMRTASIVSFFVHPRFQSPFVS